MIRASLEHRGEFLAIGSKIAHQLFGADFEIAHQRLDQPRAQLVLGGEFMAARG
ncbi:MAG: hypothetical protein IE922_16660 [Sphingomonadales bacterium]|nr:hypothetical protein [Sphingomonadales bacterium]